MKDIHRRTRKVIIRRGDSIPILCRRKGIPANLRYRWSKYFLKKE